MKRRKSVIVSFVSVITVLVFCVAISAAIALFSNYAISKGSYGQVALRSYFEKGSGAADDPFVITRPRHLYNLSVLQGLGVFDDKEKANFKLGLEGIGENPPDNTTPLCYVGETNETKRYLDMSSTYSNYELNPINAIGSETTPFYGVFDGQNVEIKNLTVYADPEDAGLFGYIAHGGKVKNLFLDNITINAKGYTADYAFLYGSDSSSAMNSSSAMFKYDMDPNTVDPNNADIKDFTASSSNTVFTNYFFTETSSTVEGKTTYTFTLDTSEGSETSIVPSIDIDYNHRNEYDYFTILSGDLIKYNSNGLIKPNISEVLKFFADQKGSATKYPIQASSTVSLIVSSVDNNGLKHSKVLLVLEFDYSLDNATSTFIRLGVRVGKEHKNNIGLIAGHCDGTLDGCYVHKGTFETNNGTSEYTPMENGSNFGLIGLAGNTVQNGVQNSSDNPDDEGKTIGVLDFTSIYKDIVADDTFSNSYDPYPNNGVDPDVGVTYKPSSTSKYLSYLRSDTDNTDIDLKYVTLQQNAVSFAGQKIIRNNDLGVFTVVTDPSNDNNGRMSGNLLNRSYINKENDINYIYYSTGEYSSESGIAFSRYRNSFNSNNPTDFIIGNHFPDMSKVTKESFDVRERHHNFYVRFKLESDYRSNHGGFYFSDLYRDNSTHDGSVYLNTYLNYKLVDKNNINIPTDSNLCGIMAKNNLREEISSFSSSFATEDLSGANRYAYAYQNPSENNKKYIGHAINFEIKTADYANVTIIAAPTDRNKGAALGVYKIDDVVGETPYDFDGNKFLQRYNEPDYAFFMPKDNYLSYFDYKVGSNETGQIGTWDYNTTTGAYTFNPADYTKNATVVSDGHEYDYHNETRLFAHTFYLPKGRYFIGSATGTNDGADLCSAKVFYVCTQGQDSGEYEFDNSAFSGDDKIDNIDFVKQSRVSANDTYNFLMNDINNQRCFIILDEDDRSKFTSQQSKITFDYVANSGFVIKAYTYNTSTHAYVETNNPTTIVEHIAVSNYGTTALDVSLFGTTSNSRKIVYPRSNT